ncbi:MAG: hypothetical protein K1X89_14095 [Myxococcaceae bacterium]|nr:hypothetical protein [Myxococcaceae bacterium]
MRSFRHPALVALVLAATARAQAPEAFPSNGEGVTVHVAPEDADLRLVRLTLGVGQLGNVVSTSREVCRAPCDRLVAALADSFQVAGPGITTSDPFSLRGHGPSVKLTVTQGSSTVHSVGEVLFGLGITALVVAAASLPLSAGVPVLRPGGYIVGGVSLGTGLVSGAIGLFLLLTSATRVELAER